MECLTATHTHPNPNPHSMHTIQALLDEGPLDDYSAAYIAACALLGLQHLHYLGVIYRRGPPCHADSARAGGHVRARARVRVCVSVCLCVCVCVYVCLSPPRAG